MTQPRTERAKYHFKVSECGDGRCGIGTESLGGTDIALLKEARAHLGFELPDGTSFERAREIANFLNHNLVYVTVTVLDDEFQNQVRRDPKPR